MDKYKGYPYKIVNISPHTLIHNTIFHKSLKDIFCIRSYKIVSYDTSDHNHQRQFKLLISIFNICFKNLNENCSSVC